MTTIKNNEHKKLNFSSEREQSQVCLNSAEHEKNQGRKVLNVPNLRFPEFQGEWEYFLINDVCSEFKSGKNIKADSVFECGEYPVYGGNGLRGYTSSYNHEGSYVLIGRQGALCGNVRSVYGKTYITEHAIAVAGNEKSNTNFLHYLFLKMNLGQYSDQSAQPGLAVNKLLKLKVALPIISEQTKIAKLLSLLDERIATQNKIIDKLQSLIKGISNRIFASIQGIEYRMGDIVTIINGNSNVQDAVTQSKDGLYPFFDRSEDIKYLPTFLFDKEAIIYPGEGTEFMPRYFKGKFALHQRCYAIFDFNEIINARFLYFYLKTRNSYFVKNAVGSTVPSLRLDTFQKLKVIIPPKKIQHSVSLCLSSMEQKCNVEKKILHKLLKQKQYLLRQMFI